MHQIVNDSSIVPSLVKGMSMCTDVAIDDIYILTKRSEGKMIVAVFTNVEYIRFIPRQP